MSPKQKAVIFTDLLAMQKLAMEKTISHEREADRYRQQFRAITSRILDFHVGKKRA